MCFLSFLWLDRIEANEHDMPNTVLLASLMAVARAISHRLYESAEIFSIWPTRHFFAFENDVIAATDRIY